MEEDVVAFWNWADCNSFEQPVQEALTFLHAVAAKGQNRRKSQANEKDGDSHEESGEGASGADVEQGFSGGYSSFHSDDGAHGSEGTPREGNEVGQGRWDLVESGGDVVPEFMKEENCEQGNSEGPTAEIAEPGEAFVFSEGLNRTGSKDGYDRNDE